MIGLALRLVWFLSWIITLPWRVARRLVGVPRGSYLAVEIDGPIDEIPAPRRLWPLPGGRRFSVHALASLVDEVSKDARVQGLLVTVRSIRGGFASLASVRSVLARARAAGKRVVLYLPLGGGTREAYLATIADRVLLGPRASLAPVGILASTRYVRGALDRAGLVPEVYARGRYKTAAEAIERTSMSEAQREQLDAVLDRVHAEVVDAIGEGRHVDPARARAIVDGAPYVGQEAVAAGLVDDVAYEDGVASRAQADGARSTLRPADGYMKARLGLRSRAFEASGAVAVVRVHGAIAGAGAMPLRSMAVDERIIAAIRLARSHAQVRGVVLHVNSPGGGALASDRIHHELVQLAREKPLVACMGDVAASGGYYVAVAAHEIVARPTTITGSIGVISARVIAEPLMARLGIATQVLQRGAHARVLDPFAPLDEETRRAIEREIDVLYRGFVQIVADGRRRSVDDIEALAQGRVWTGADAHARGLVDRLGGFEDALAAVRERIGEGASRLRTVVVRPPRSPLPTLPPPGDAAARLAAAALEPLMERLGLDPALLSLSAERVLAYSSVAACLVWA